jgi:hypothetical protein
MRTLRKTIVASVANTINYYKEEYCPSTKASPKIKAGYALMSHEAMKSFFREGKLVAW